MSKPPSNEYDVLIAKEKHDTIQFLLFVVGTVACYLIWKLL